MTGVQNKAGKSFSVTLKIIIIGVLILFLMGAVSNIESLIVERQERRATVLSDITATWGGEQTVGGPVLVVPYEVPIIEEVISGKKTTTRIVMENHVATFLPEELKIEGQVHPEVRNRSLYQVLLYLADLKMEGHFVRPDVKMLSIPEKSIRWDKAYVILGMGDRRSLREQVNLQWKGSPLEMEPNQDSESLFPQGLQANVPSMGDLMAGEKIPFSLNVKITGTRDLKFIPLGKKTHVHLQSPWHSPSFQGQYAPVEREVSAQGFSAKWDVFYLARNYPQSWLDRGIGIDQLLPSAFGVELLFPVDVYQTSLRSVKYAVLFIVLTFVIFFLFEVLNRLRIHPVQYLLVGFGMCLFYVLLVSLSEHLSFGLSYLLSSLSMTALISCYSYWALKGKKPALMMGVFLSGLYGFLYILLRAEDYALLFGAVGLFLMLAIVMGVTRKIDWYGLGAAFSSLEGEEKTKESLKTF